MSVGGGMRGGCVCVSVCLWGGVSEVGGSCLSSESTLKGSVGSGPTEGTEQFSIQFAVAEGDKQCIIFLMTCGGLSPTSAAY